MKDELFFIELIIYECFCNALISDCPSNDQKWDSKKQMFIMKLYNNTMTTTVNEGWVAYMLWL